MTDVGLAPIPPGEWRVDIETRGRSGTLRYREGDQCIGFDWEFGSGDVVAVIRGPDPDAGRAGTTRSTRRGTAAR